MPETVTPYQIYRPFEVRDFAPIRYDPIKIVRDEQGKVDEGIDYLTLATSWRQFQGVNAGIRLYINPQHIADVAHRLGRLNQRFDMDSVIASGDVYPHDLPVLAQLLYRTNSPTLMGRAQYFLAELTDVERTVYLDTRGDKDYRPAAMSDYPAYNQEEILLGSFEFNDANGRLICHHILPYEPPRLALLTTRFVNIPPGFDGE